MTQLARKPTPAWTRVAAATPERRRDRPGRAVAAIVVVGLLLTLVAAWGAHRTDQATEERLLKTQTEQAAAVLSTAIFLIQQPLTTALQVQATSGPDGDPSVFRRTFAVNVGDEGLYVSASLWHREGGEIRRLAAVGDEPAMDPDGREVQRFLRRALKSKTSVVEPVTIGDRMRIAYALADPETGFIVKVERALPANRRAPVDRDSAYSNLDYAIYLGEGTNLADMTTTDVDPADLPLDEPSHETTVPFGDTVLTLVTRPSDHLGSTLSQRLPLIVLFGGLLLTLATALVARRLVGSQARERDVFLRLQRALLPHRNPEVPGLQIASTYVAGAEGIEIGGDWYSVIAIDEDSFGFVVGDVSGRGVDAVAEMARARFTLRSYLLDGSSPAEALEKCSHQFDITVDEHIVTAVVGLGNARTGEVVLASAGHPPPLVHSPDGSSYVPVPVGPPLGVGPSSYEMATFTVPPGSTLLAFTDGLVERRGEDIDTGMQRLADAADRHGRQPVADLVSSLLGELRAPGAADDIAVLALRRA